MGFKLVLLKQYQEKANQASVRFHDFSQPPQGWLKTIRLALGMSGVQLADRLGVTKGRISQAESSEADGGITLKSMQNIAQAMGCRLVYAVVPERLIEELIKAQAIEKAKLRVKEASIQMALEAQTLDKKKLDAEIERLANDIMDKMPSDLWSKE